MRVYLKYIHKNKNFSLFFFTLLILNFYQNTAHAKENTSDWKNNTKKYIHEQITLNKLRIEARDRNILWIPLPKDFEISYQQYGFFIFFKIPYIFLICPFGILLTLNCYIRNKYKSQRTVNNISEHPPENLTPAEMSYIYHMGYRHEAFLSTLLDLHIRGFINIAKMSDRSFAITKTFSDLNGLSTRELFILTEWFKDSLTITNNDQSYIQLKNILYHFSSNLTTNYKSYFTNIRKPKTLCEIAVLALFIPIVILSEATLPFLSLYLMASFLYLGFSKFHHCTFPKKKFETLYNNIESFRKFLTILKESPQDILNSPNYDFSKDCLKRYLPYMVALKVVEDWDIDFVDTLKSDLSVEELSTFMSIGLSCRGFGFNSVFSYQYRIPLNSIRPFR